MGAPKGKKHAPGAGRPKFKIDWKRFDQMCFVQCTQEEIAAFLGCSVATIERRVEEDHGIKFAEYYAQKSAGGTQSLRRAQYKAAMAGNPALLIWLGKQKLGQRDKQEVTGVDGGPIKQEVVVERKPVSLEEAEDLARQTLASVERARERAKRSAGGS
jgi:hypothetical protein